MQAIKNARLKDFELYTIFKRTRVSLEDRSDAEPAVLKRLEKQMQAIYRECAKGGTCLAGLEMAAARVGADHLA